MPTALSAATPRPATRALATVLGEVTVARLAYRRKGEANLHPADGTLNLPPERHSHGLRRLAAVESSRGSFEEAAGAIERGTGTRVGKRQVEEFAARSGADIDAFHEAVCPKGPADGDVVVLSAELGGGCRRRPLGGGAVIHGRLACGGVRPCERS